MAVILPVDGENLKKEIKDDVNKSISTEAYLRRQYEKKLESKFEDLQKEQATQLAKEQELYETSETARTTTFNSAEANRVDTFNKNEEARDAKVDEKLSDITNLQNTVSEHTTSISTINSNIDSINNNLNTFTNIIDYSQLTEYAGVYSNETGTWEKSYHGSTNHKFKIVQTNGATKGTITAENVVGCRVELMSELPPVPIVAGTTATGILDFFSITKGDTKTFSIPENCVCIVVQTLYWSNSCVPTSTILSGVGLNDRVSEIEEELNGEERTALVVDASGSGNYTSLHECLKYCTENSDTLFEVQVKEGTYDVGADWSDEELSNANYPSGFYGTIVPSNTNLIGVGDRDKVIITATNNSSYTWADCWRYISPLNVHGGSTIKNITVKGSGMRYAVHHDFSSANGKTTIYDNCVILYDDTSFSTSAMGCGSHNGEKVFVNNCVVYPTLGWHGHNPATSGSYLEINNSQIGRLYLYDYLTGYDEEVICNNCNIGIVEYNKAVASGVQYMKLKCNNTIAPICSDYSFVYDMTGIANYWAANDISAYNAVIRANPTTISLSSNSNLYGITLEDINGIDTKDVAPNIGKVLVNGYIDVSLLGLTDVSVGSRIGYNGSAFSVVDSGGIGIVELYYKGKFYARIG